jgi:hypothetical protein
MSRLTDTQLVILSAASRRDDRGVELPTNIKGEAARTVVASAPACWRRSAPTARSRSGDAMTTVDRWHCASPRTRREVHRADTRSVQGVPEGLEPASPAPTVPAAAENEQNQDHDDD